MSKIKTVIAGASGRMGRTLVRLIAETDDLVVSGALERQGHPDLGKDAGILAGIDASNVVFTDDPLPVLAQADALLDFTSPATSVALAALAAQARIVHVLGTTGLSKDDDAKVRAAARHAVIVKSGSMSVG